MSIINNNINIYISKWSEMDTNLNHKPNLTIQFTWFVKSHFVWHNWRFYIMKEMLLMIVHPFPKTKVGVCSQVHFILNTKDFLHWLYKRSLRTQNKQFHRNNFSYNPISDLHDCMNISFFQVIHPSPHQLIKNQLKHLSKFFQW